MRFDPAGGNDLIDLVIPHAECLNSLACRTKRLFRSPLAGLKLFELIIGQVDRIGTCPLFADSLELFRGPDKGRLGAGQIWTVDGIQRLVFLHLVA